MSVCVSLEWTGPNVPKPPKSKFGVPGSTAAAHVGVRCAVTSKRREQDKGDQPVRRGRTRSSQDERRSYAPGATHPWDTVVLRSRPCGAGTSAIQSMQSNRPTMCATYQWSGTDIRYCIFSTPVFEMRKIIGQRVGIDARFCAFASAHAQYICSNLGSAVLCSSNWPTFPAPTG